MTLTGCSDDRDRLIITSLSPWIKEQRWFPAGDNPADMSSVGVDLSPTIRIVFLDLGQEHQTLIQVPTSRTPNDPAGTTHHDAATSPEFVKAWLRHAEGHVGAVDPLRSRPMPGEQSNTSVVLSTPEGPAAVLKVLRAVQAGPNPEVDVPRKLAEVGWDGAPRMLAWLRVALPGSTEPAYVGSLTAYIPDATDGFTLACDHARTNASFISDAGELGVLVAGMHRSLATAFGTVESDPDWLIGALRDRFRWARQHVPGLARYAFGVDHVAQAVSELGSLPLRQRVHGDLHLGQVLRGERWYVTDFEGEPLVPLSARTQFELPARDLAGMVRSFDYAAAVGQGSFGSGWSHDAREAFLDAYRGDMSRARTATWSVESDQTILTALEVDKALYEVVYESQHRPDWAHIPIRALDRLFAG